MLKSYVKTLAIIAGLGWAGAAGAVGFGNANVNSALGQPLKIEIALTDVSESDRSSMSAHLASPDAFKAAGLDYPYQLSKLKFDITVRGRQTYIIVTSKEPVNDSFINVLVELNWPSGKLLREYTFLLDPPDYKPEQSQAEAIAPIAPVLATAPAVEAPQPEPVQAAASAPEAASAPAEAMPGTEPLVVTAAPASMPEATATGIQEADLNAASGVQPAAAEAQTAPATQPEPEPAPARAPAARETVTVKRGDTLSKIAAQVREPDMTLEQMLVALYRANVNKFDGKNMNRIRAGKILTLPEPADYEHLSQKAAAKEIRVQTANWRAYRQKLAAAGTTAPEQAPTQATGGKISTSVAEQAPQPKEPANGKLVLSKGEAPGDKTAGGKQATENAAKEEAIAQGKQAKEDQTRIATQEKINQDLKKAIELKGGVPQPASPVTATVPPVAASPVHAASGVHRVQPNVVQPAPAEAETSFLDEILDMPELKDPVYLAGGAGILLLLLGGGFYLKRRSAGEGGGRKKKR